VSGTANMSPAALLEICDRALEAARRAGAEEAEVAADFSSGARIDFEKNDLSIALSDDEVSLGLRVVKNGRAGFAATNDPDALEAAAADAVAIAKTATEDPHAGFGNARALEPVEGLLDGSIDEIGVAEVTRSGARLLELVRERDARLSVDSGGVSVSRGTRAVASTLGVRCAEETSYIGGHVFGMAVDGDALGSFVVEGDASRRASDLEGSLDGTAERFAEKALGALHPEAGESYRGPILLSPEAVQSLLVSELVGMISSPRVRKGKTPLADKLGETVAHADFHLLDDGRSPGRLGSSAFDREGQPRPRVSLVENGVLQTYLYDEYEARAAGLDHGTGHARGGATSQPSIGTSRLVLRAGDRPLADLEREAGRCVVVTRFSGSTNAITGEFSGVVKAGFLSREGERRPVTETLISGNVLEALKSIAGVSRETRCLFGGSELPWVMVDGISVTAG
jgi:PmbA protein